MLHVTIVDDFPVFSFSKDKSLDVAGLVAEGVIMNLSLKKGEIEGSWAMANRLDPDVGFSSYGSSDI